MHLCPHCQKPTPGPFDSGASGFANEAALCDECRAKTPEQRAADYLRASRRAQHPQSGARPRRKRCALCSRGGQIG